MLITSRITSPFGAMHICCDENGISRICLPGSQISKKIGESCSSDGIPAVLELAAQQLQEYFDGKRVCFELPLSLHGTDFQQKVWNRIHRIPYGQTMTYGEIARKLGGINKARAVGGAANANPLPIVIPCHRVVGSDGSLTGYAGGLEMKQQLLALEKKLVDPQQCQ